ncbi:MAG: HEPN domain-containing protein [Candidatus Heimdallarchaeota archaeon]|nr:HEPN domain-containing protein [Candidatus Heimdallarchaeota archaeon]
MHKEQIDLLLTRGKNFLESAENRFKNKDWDLTCFFAEQSVQLYIKAVILELSGSSPRIHSLRRLIALLGQIIDEKIEYERKSLLFLESAYFNARYLPFKYEKQDAEEALRIAKELITLVKNYRIR